MKKILIPADIKKLIKKQKSFLDRSHLKIFTMTSNEEAFNIHCAEKANLIITKFDMPGMSSEIFCSLIREDRKLQDVSIILICNNSKADIERTSRCKANAIVTMPLDRTIFLEKAHQLLNISRRESCRIPLSVRISGKHKNRPFLCHLENISSSGILFETDNKLAGGDIMSCSFFLPNSKHIVADGEIVRVDKKEGEFDANRYGIRFSNIT
ncbi:MAG: response regulator, partial [Nitrospirae bacterium]